MKVRDPITGDWTPVLGAPGATSLNQLLDVIIPGNVEPGSETQSLHTGSVLMYNHTLGQWLPGDVPAAELAPGSAPGDVLTWDATTGTWVPAQPASATGDFLPLTGGTLTGPLTTTVINANGTINANAGMLVAAGDRIDFAGTTLGTRANWYGTTFYTGIQSGTLQHVVPVSNKHQFMLGTVEKARVDTNGVVAPGFFVSDTWHGWTWSSTDNAEHLRSYQGDWRFMKTNGSVPGTQVARIHNGGATFPSVDVTNSHIQISGSSGSDSAHFYVNCENNNDGSYFNVLEARRANFTNVFHIKGYQHANSCHIKFYANLGTEGVDECGYWGDYGDGQVCAFSHGPMSSTHFQDRNLFSAVAGTAAPVDPELAGRLIDAAKPITFGRHFRSPTATDSNPEGFVRPEHDPIPTLGLDFEGVDGPLADRLVNRRDGGYSLGGMVSLLVAEVQQLRARVAQLEAQEAPA